MVKDFLSKFTVSRECFDLRALEDPVALKTAWNPLVSGGWSFCTHRLSSNNGIRRMHVSAIAHLFCFFCIGFGVIVSSYIAWSLSDPSAVTSGNIPLWLVPFMPLIFSVVGAGMLWWLYRKNVLFDKKRGAYTYQGESFPLQEVHAIQLIREYCSGGSNNSSYLSFEMNLVLKTGERFNVTDHGSLGAIRVDGKKLSEYLDIPVWDLIDYEIRVGNH